MTPRSFRARGSFVAVFALFAVLAAVPLQGNPALRGYSRYDSFQRQLEQIAQSPYAKLESLAETDQGRDIYLLEISSRSAEGKPAILMVGNCEESHVTGSELALRMARYLVQHVDKDERVNAFLDRFVLYVIPRPDPDATERQWARPWRERTGNGKATDDDGDFQVGEDPPEDLNSDGWITMMRIADPTGRYIAHPEEPRLLIEADRQKNEQGTYLLYVEGTDNDHDEHWNEDGGDGVEFDRNFPFRYEAFVKGSGPHAVSEQATRAVADFAYDHPEIAIVFSFSSHDNLMHPWTAESSPDEDERLITSVRPDDAPYFQYFADRYQEILQIDDAPDPASTGGSFAEWAYYHYGRWSLSARAWWPPQPAEAEDSAGEETPDDDRRDADSEAPDESGDESDDDDRGAEELAAIEWFEHEGVPAIREWQRIEHPDFPGRTVEVGGLLPFYRTHPPSKYLDSLAEKHAEFVLRLGRWMPRLQIDSTKIEPLGEGVFRIEARIVNRGYLPTISEMGERSRQLQRLQVSLRLPRGVTCIDPPVRRRVDRLDGLGGNQTFRWLLRSDQEKLGRIFIRCWSPPVGEATVMVTDEEEP